MTLTDFIGIPYKDRGRGFDAGDCWNVCWLFHRHIMGNDVPDYVIDYTGAGDRHSVSAAIENNIGRWVKIDGEPQYGDVLVFSICGLPIHTGVYIGNGEFLHALKGCNSCIETLNSITWQKRLKQVIRWKDN